MPRNWCVPSRCGWPDPCRCLRTVAVLLALGLLSAATLHTRAQATTPDGTAPAQPDLLRAMRAALAESHPGIDAAAMLDYYSRTSPDIHAEIRSRIEGAVADTPAYLRRLADHYQRIDRLRQRSPAEHERLVALDLLESRARMLGRLILQLGTARSDQAAEDAAGTRAAMSRAKDELRSVLERAFDGTQQNQRIELNRLEAELRTMRRLLDERASKRNLIIRQRFIELCGQELPPPTPAPAPAPEPAPPPAPTTGDAAPPP